LYLRASNQRSILLIHGFLTTCDEFRGSSTYTTIMANTLEHRVACLEYSTRIGTIVTTMESQASRACEAFQKWVELDRPQDKITLVGLSQGGLIARHILQTCKGGEVVDVLLTVGTPNAGISRVPYTIYNGLEGYFNIAITYSIFSWYIQAWFGPSGYFKSLESGKLQQGQFIETLNNDGSFDQNSKDRVIGLKKWILIRFNADNVVIPNISEHFGFWASQEQNSLYTIFESKGYQEDLIGLKTLYNSNRLILKTLPGNHLEMTSEEVISHIAHQIQ